MKYGVYLGFFGLIELVGNFPNYLIDLEWPKIPWRKLQAFSHRNCHLSIGS